MWWALGALALFALGIVGLALCRMAGQQSDRMAVEFDYWEHVDLPGYLLARHVKPATPAERQEAHRQRLACADCPQGRDPIDVELARMIANEEFP